MTEKSLFAEMIKERDKFEQKVLIILHALKEKHGSLNIVTSLFELLGMLHMEYNRDNVDKLEKVLECIVDTPFHLQGLSGFTVATRAIEDYDLEDETGRLVITLGKLFRF